MDLFERPDPLWTIQDQDLSKKRGEAHSLRKQLKIDKETVFLNEKCLVFYAAVKAADATPDLKFI